MRDLRYTLRGLLREPMLLVAATPSIALGAGGNVAVFGLANEFVLRSAGLLATQTKVVRWRVSHGSHVSYQRWLDLEAERRRSSTSPDTPSRARSTGSTATPRRLHHANDRHRELLRRPWRSRRDRPRIHAPAEARAERDPHIVVVSHGFWRRELAGDSAVDRTRRCSLNGERIRSSEFYRPSSAASPGSGSRQPCTCRSIGSLVPRAFNSEGNDRRAEWARLEPDGESPGRRAAVDGDGPPAGAASPATRCTAAYRSSRAVGGVAIRESPARKTLGGFPGNGRPRVAALSC